MFRVEYMLSDQLGDFAYSDIVAAESKTGAIDKVMTAFINTLEIGETCETEGESIVVYFHGEHECIIHGFHAVKVA